jgi:hypothetical protein
MIHDSNYIIIIIILIVISCHSLLVDFSLIRVPEPLLELVPGEGYSVAISAQMPIQYLSDFPHVKLVQITSTCESEALAGILGATEFDCCSVGTFSFESHITYPYYAYKL